MRRLLPITVLCLTVGLSSADDNGAGNNTNPFPNNNGNGNGYPNNGNNNGGQYPNNNGNGNGYPNNNGNGYPNNGNNNGGQYPNNNGNGYPNNNGNGYPNSGNSYANNNGYSSNFVTAIEPARNAVGKGSANIAREFRGTGSGSTQVFPVRDKWEAFCLASEPVNLSVISAADGSLVTGAATAPHGNLGSGCTVYLGKGGYYYFQVESRNPSANWGVYVVEVATGTALSNSGNLGGALSGALPGGAQYSPPTITMLPTGSPIFASPGYFGNSININMAGNGNGNINGYGNGYNNGMPQAPAPIVKLTEDQTRAVVLIKGDKAEGTGFLVKTPEGPQVVTNIHVIADNPNLKVTTNTGALITVLSEKGASDRDLAMLSIKDNGYSYLEMATDISKVVQPGDEVVTPGNSEGGEVMLNTGGKVLGIGPERIEFDNPIYHGNSGGPVFHTKSGKVLGVVTEATKVDTTDDLDKASFSSRNSAISGQMRYFGLRLDTVATWIPIDSRQFQIETAFLDQFHEQSRNLDAYLNSDSHGRTDDGKDVSGYYLNDEKIMKAVNSYRQKSNGSDTGQMLQAQRDFVFDLQSIADINTVPIKNANNFYSFDQERARDELDYRNALKKEIDSISGNVDRMSHLPRTNN